MSRVPTAGDRIVVRPQNNVYTVLAASGALAVLTALILLFLRANAMNISLF